MQPSAVAFFSDNLWFFEIFLGVAVLIAVNFLFTKIVKHIRHKTLSTSSGWKEKIDYIFITPRAHFVMVTRNYPCCGGSC